jgi:methylenetetrahydrofolate reductase (NADPH)
MAGDVPGVVIPNELVKRMDEAGDKESQQAVGVEIALDIIEKLKNTPKLAGMHIMAVHWEDIVPRLIDESGLPKPSIHDLPEAEGSIEPVGEKPVRA